MRLPLNCTYYNHWFSMIILRSKSWVFPTIFAFAKWLLNLLFKKFLVNILFKKFYQRAPENYKIELILNHI